MGDNLTALTSYNKVLELDPENKEAHEALSQYSFRYQYSSTVKYWNSIVQQW